MRRCVGAELGGNSISGVVTSAYTPDSPPDRMSVPPVLVTAQGGTRWWVLRPSSSPQQTSAGCSVTSTGVSAIPVPVVGSDGSARLEADLVAMMIGGLLRQFTRVAASVDRVEGTQLETSHHRPAGARSRATS